MASSARSTDSGLSAYQSLKRNAAEPVETIDLLSPSSEAAGRRLPVEQIDLTRSQEARQPGTHCSHKAIHTKRSAPAQRQRRDSIVSVGESAAAIQPAANRLQLGTSSGLEDASAFSAEPPRRLLQYNLPPDWTPTPTPDISPEPEALARKVIRMYTTWCSKRLIFLAMFVVVGDNKLTNAGVRLFYFHMPHLFRCNAECVCLKTIVLLVSGLFGVAVGCWGKQD